MEVRRPIASFYPLSLFYMCINFVGSLDREEIMHWCIMGKKEKLGRVSPTYE